MAVLGNGNRLIGQAYMTEAQRMKLRIEEMCRSHQQVNPEELEQLVDQLIELEKRINR